MPAPTRRNFLKTAAAVPLAVAYSSSAARGRPVDSDPDPTTDAWIEVNLPYIGWNLRQVQARSGNRPVLAVIKANAYGHGLVDTARYLQSLGIHGLAVGNIREALLLRRSGITSPILNLGPFSARAAESIVQLDISQSVFSSQFDRLAREAESAGKRARVHIKIDSGLGRVGVPYDRAIPFVEKVAAARGILIEGIFTTFTEDHDFDRLQLERFLDVCSGCERRGISLPLRHAASSAGILDFPDAHLDMVRPGIMLYGHYPSMRAFQQRVIDLRPALSLKARLTYLKTLRPGESISYHRAFTAQENICVATLPIGYSDGYPAQAAGKAMVIVRGRRSPLIAAVTSNHSTADVSALPGVELGDEVVLIGSQDGTSIDAQELAEWAGISVYRLLIGLSPLLPRIFTS